MQIPNNFHIIDKAKITIKGEKCYIETCKRNDGSVWVFQKNGVDDGRSTLFKNRCLYFIFDWDKQSFNIRVCKLGDGMNGTDIKSNEIFNIRYVRSKEMFLEMIIAYVIHVLRMPNF